ncbi:MAG: hypothetical protein LBT46_09765 [Planctomycetaceae bacterium]|nr:hypothetical protein [Planctomycetaceae bacterium]
MRACITLNRCIVHCSHHPLIYYVTCEHTILNPAGILLPKGEDGNLYTAVKWYFVWQKSPLPTEVPCGCQIPVSKIRRTGLPPRTKEPKNLEEWMAEGAERMDELMAERMAERAEEAKRQQRLDRGNDPRWKDARWLNVLHILSEKYESSQCGCCESNF